jgi:hypothetical protein
MRQARWLTDPLHKYEMRYWSGSGWTGHVADAGVAGWDVTGLEALCAVSQVHSDAAAGTSGAERSSGTAPAANRKSARASLLLAAVAICPLVLQGLLFPLNSMIDQTSMAALFLGVASMTCFTPLMVLSPIAAVASLVMGARARADGERSLVTYSGKAAAVLALVFYLVFAITLVLAVDQWGG